MRFEKTERPRPTQSSGQPGTGPSTPGSTSPFSTRTGASTPPRRHRGAGLYFLGLTWPLHRGSALIGWVKNSAEFLAEQIAAFQDDPRSWMMRANRQPTTARRRRKLREKGFEAWDTTTIPRPESTVIESFPTETEGLPEATRPEIVELADSDSFDLEIAAVAKRVGDATVHARLQRIDSRTDAEAPAGLDVTVHVTNRGDLEATVHWHGLRQAIQTARTTRRRRSPLGRLSPTK